jgi:hypothetical protein
MHRLLKFLCEDMSLLLVLHQRVETGTRNT